MEDGVERSEKLSEGVNMEFLNATEGWRMMKE